MAKRIRRSSVPLLLRPFFPGMQTHSIAEGEPWGLPLQFPTQANIFKTLGYNTWHVGKVCSALNSGSITLSILTRIAIYITLVPFPD